MKFITLILSCILILIFFHANATNVSGNVYGHWTLANSPYNVVNNLVIPSDSTLIIDAGVDVTFNANYEIKVDGRMVAIGTATDSITFTAPGVVPGFAGIRLEVTNAQQDSSVFEFCLVRNANRGNQFLTGMDNYGGAFLINNFNKVRIQHCTITNCRAYDGGAGIMLYNTSSILILDNDIVFNQALNASTNDGTGGGIYCKGQSNAIISRNNISHNSVVLRGSAIYAGSSHPIITNNYISQNNTYPIYINGNVDATIVGNNIEYNTGTGPAISATNTGDILIQNNNISNNTNHDYSGTLRGGGIYVTNSTNVLIKGNIIYKNTLSVTSSTSTVSGGGIYCNVSSTSAMIVGNFICNNQVLSQGDGGGVYVKSATLINNIICNNLCGGYPIYGRGGGVYTQDTVILINNTIANNSARLGGGIYINGHRNSKIYNCIVWGNEISSNANGKQIYCNNGLTTLNYTISNCNIDSGQAGIGLLNNNLLGMIYQNNIDTVPMFVNPTDTAWTTADATLADWHLMGSSLCINSGDSTYVTEATDLSGNARVHDSNVDMGAYEYQSIVFSLPNANFTVSNNIICAKDSLLLTNQSTNATTYSWTFQDGTPATSTSQNPSVLWTTGGQKTIKLVVTNNFGVDSLTKTITINSVDTSVVVANASLFSNAANASYQWLLCNGNYTALFGETNQTFTPTMIPAFYALEVTQNGCVDTSACYAVIVTTNPVIASFANKQNGEAISVYPNPANDILNIQINSKFNIQNSKFSITIQNTLGEVVYTKQICNAMESIDVSAFANGLYILKVYNDVLKFIKQ